MSYFKHHTTGLTSRSGKRYFAIPTESGSVYLSASIMALSPNALRSSLNSAGIPASTTKHLESWTSGLAAINDFPNSDVIERPGWNVHSHVTAKSVQFTPKNEEPQPSIFATLSPTKSSLKAWNQDVGQVIVDQGIIIFATMVALAAPILDLVPRLKGTGFNIVGPPGCGKSSLSSMIAALAGWDARRVPGSDGQSDSAAFAPWLETRRDQLVILDGFEATLAGETERKKIDRIKHWLFNAANSPSAGMYMIGSRKPVATMGGEDNDVISASSERLYVIDLAGRPLGILDTVPLPFVTANEAVAELVKRFELDAGHAMSKFLQRLVNSRHKDEAALRARIERLVAKFCEQAGADPNCGSEIRSAEPFGVVHAAGVLAQGWKVLPADIKCGPTVLGCYRPTRRARLLNVCRSRCGCAA